MSCAWPGSLVGDGLYCRGRKIADSNCGRLLTEDHQRRHEDLSTGCRLAMAVAIGAVRREMDDLGLCLLKAAGLGVGDTEKFY